MEYVFLAIFIIVTFIHLYASLKQNKKLRAISKVFIIPSLIGFYLMMAPVINWYIFVALVLSFLGDVFLILNGIKWFTIGGISFMIGHAFFIVGYSVVTDFSVIPWWVIIPLAVIFMILTFFIFKALKPYLPKPLFYPMALYLVINGLMNCFAIYRLIANPYIGSILTAIGALLFFASDSSLFFVRFKKDSFFQTHFFIMLTYSIGEFLIILGMIL